MERRTYLLSGLAAITAGAIAALALTRAPAEPSAEAVMAPGVTQPSSATLPAANPPSAPPAPAKKSTTQLISDTTSGDAKTRAAAIEALADAPRAEALPVLGRILTNGEPEIDRVLALRSLRDLALNQGDADGAIRDAIRHALYHGDDFTKTADVQEALEIIEESLMRQ